MTEESGPDANQALFQRDLAVRQLKVQQANLQVIKLAMNDNRPLEALFTANNALDELEDTLETFEQWDEEVDEDAE